MRAHLIRLVAVMISLLFSWSASGGIESYTFTKIVDTSDGFFHSIFGGFGLLVINSEGTVAFSGIRIGQGGGIFTSNGGPIATLAASGRIVGDFSLSDGTVATLALNKFGEYSINDAGTVALLATLEPDSDIGISCFTKQGIFTSNSGGTINTITVGGLGSGLTSLPGRPFWFCSAGPRINNAGTIAFLIETVGDSIFTIANELTKIIARSFVFRFGECPSPFDVGARQLGTTPRIGINNGNTVVFTAGLSSGRMGIFTGNGEPWPSASNCIENPHVIGEPHTTIATTDGPIRNFGSPVINDAKEVAFRTTLDAGGEGIFINSSTVATTSGPYSGFGRFVSMNNSGGLAFSAELDVGGKGIYFGPDPLTDKVIQTGDSLFGSIVTDLSPISYQALNDAGQIVFLATLASGVTGIYRAEPGGKCEVPEGGAPVVEQVFLLRGCGSSDDPTTSIPGNVLALWGAFGKRPVLEADSNEKLEVQCVGGDHYELHYISSAGERRRVGICPFRRGCNKISINHSGAVVKDGIKKPTCFLWTVWESRDYGHNDNPNPWTGEPEENQVLDWAYTVFDVNNRTVTKKDYKFTSRTASGFPPVEPYDRICVGGFPVAPEVETLDNPMQIIPSIIVDPPLGPETEAFFDEVVQRMEALPPETGPMIASSVALCDLNQDRRCDGTDFLLFQSVAGKCAGELGYHPLADPDQDGCLISTDQEILFPEGVLISLNPAKVWVGLKNSDGVGLRLDLKAEVYLDETKIGEGQLNSIASGSSGFNNAKLNTIPLSLSEVSVSVPPNAEPKIMLSVRRTCFGGGHHSGTPRLWFNDSQANSHFGAMIGDMDTEFYLHDGFTLATNLGIEPKKTIDVTVSSSSEVRGRIVHWQAKKRHA